MPRPNWFLAFPLDGAFVLELPAPPAAFRPYHPEDVHLTLAFLGGCGEAGAERALAALDEKLALARPPAIEATLGAVVPMGGSRRHYSALSALLAHGREAAIETTLGLRDTLTEAATGRREARPPKPHVTLARPKRRASPADREAGLAWAEALDLAAVGVRLDRIALYTWHERRVERLFRIVAERPLG
jgi:RNA 2',3'-cyclic 3'-phosphodiesterase